MDISPKNLILNLFIKGPLPGQTWTPRKIPPEGDGTPFLPFSRGSPLLFWASPLLFGPNTQSPRRGQTRPPARAAPTRNKGGTSQSWPRGTTTPPVYTTRRLLYPRPTTRPARAGPPRQDPGATQPAHTKQAALSRGPSPFRQTAVLPTRTDAEERSTGKPRAATRAAALRAPTRTIERSDERRSAGRPTASDRPLARQSAAAVRLRSAATAACRLPEGIRPVALPGAWCLLRRGVLRPRRAACVSLPR